MVKLDATRQSPHNIYNNSKIAQEKTNKVWNSAARAPMFCKIVKRTTPDGKVCRYPFSHNGFRFRRVF